MHNAVVRRFLQPIANIAAMHEATCYDVSPIISMLGPACVDGLKNPWLQHTTVECGYVALQWATCSAAKASACKGIGRSSLSWSIYICTATHTENTQASIAGIPARTKHRPPFGLHMHGRCLYRLLFSLHRHIWLSGFLQVHASYNVERA